MAKQTDFLNFITPTDLIDQINLTADNTVEDPWETWNIAIGEINKRTILTLPLLIEEQMEVTYPNIEYGEEGEFYNISANALMNVMNYALKFIMEQENGDPMNIGMYDKLLTRSLSAFVNEVMNTMPSELMDFMLDKEYMDSQNQEDSSLESPYKPGAFSAKIDKGAF